MLDARPSLPCVRGSPDARLEGPPLARLSFAAFTPRDSAHLSWILSEEKASFNRSFGPVCCSPPPIPIEPGDIGDIPPPPPGGDDTHRGEPWALPPSTLEFNDEAIIAPPAGGEDGRSLRSPW